MRSGSHEVQKRNGQTVLRVRCPNVILGYKKNMDGVDR